MRKKISVILLLIIFAFSFEAINRILSFKFDDGIVQIRKLYKHEKNSIDVLFLGSSHVFLDVNTQTLFDEYGMASYVLSGSVQPFWNSYFYLKEALKTQKPKVVLLEGLAADSDFSHSDHSRIIKNNFGLNNGLLKFEALLVSSPKNRRDDYFFRYRLYHSRYKELNKSDRRDYYEKGRFRDSKGFFSAFGVRKFDRPDTFVTETEETSPMNRKQEKYFKKIVKLCKKENIPLIVFVSPYLLDSGNQKKYNFLGKLSEELSVPFINFNHTGWYEKAGLDFSKDFMDTSHLNYSGSIKLSKLLGAYIKKNFDIPDRRGDKNYESWAINSAILRNMPINANIRNATDIDAFVKNIKENKGLKLYVNTINSTHEIAGKGFFEKLGMDGDSLKDGQLYEFENGTLINLSDDKINWKRVVRLFDEKMIFQQKKFYSGRMSFVNSLFCNGKEYINDKNGAYVAVYDTVSREIVAVRQIVCKKAGDGCVLTLVKK